MPTAAEPLRYLGHGQLSTNDALGDRLDRWRTGSNVLSLLFGRADGAAAGQDRELLELRFGAVILAPESLSAFSPTDRRYAGLLSAGLHGHIRRNGLETSLGIDMVMTGPQTRIGELHRWFHQRIGNVPPAPEVLANQVGNAVHPTFMISAARPIALGDRVTLRPFVEAQAGIETLARIGGDLILGAMGRNELVLRDGATGQLYSGTWANPGNGWSATLGGDVAYVAHSALLRGVQLNPVRWRARAGVVWQGERLVAFYGASSLGPEFRGQGSGQVVGSLQLLWRF